MADLVGQMDALQRERGDLDGGAAKHIVFMPGEWRVIGIAGQHHAPAGGGIGALRGKGGGQGEDGGERNSPN